MFPIPLLENEYAKITSVKINVTCKANPTHTWGVHLRDDGLLPENWDICIKCSVEKRKGKVNNGNKADDSGQCI